MSTEVMPLGLLPASSRTGLVVEALRRSILTGELPAGQALVETELARRFGISKTPVREALKTLVGAGLVTMSEYKGATVRVVDEEMARSVFDVRSLLEPVAVARTVERGLDLDLAQDALDRASSAKDEAERSLANRDFHQLLYSNCGNPVLMNMLDGLREQTALISVNAWIQQPSWETEAAEHAEILAAARNGDAGRAAELVLNHIHSFEVRAVGQIAKGKQ
ncbi:GntR family transcriptional regulator [Arthrobacter sp. ISL-69]|uniref:GntR family transcriptional regulator n=1 Tax=Arthrobacter sp. ISL-69 TaxID=2819113 RepID=UPI001BE9C8B5|nr:GntR family transcriptional regulator [Arthrobacter sp. ISL-69]